MVHAERREVVVERVGDDGVLLAGRFCECDSGKRRAANGDEMSTQDNVHQRRADVVDCCGERERRIGEYNTVRRPTRQDVDDGGWERVRGTTSPSASATPSSVGSTAGNVHGQMGNGEASLPDDGGRQLWRSRRAK